MSTKQKATPYAYTYVHTDGRRDWRMSGSRRLPESGWTETALFNRPVHDDLVRQLQQTSDALAEVLRIHAPGQHTHKLDRMLIEQNRAILSKVQL